MGYRMTLFRVKAFLTPLLLTLLLALGLVPAANADNIYEYTGNLYSSCYGPSYAPSCWNYALSGSFETSALAPNLTNQVVTPTSFSFTDGSMILNQSNTVTSFFEVSTDSLGNIINWSVNATLYSIYYAAGYEYGSYESIYSSPTGDWSVQDIYYTYQVPIFFSNPVYCDATQSWTYECGATTYQGSALSEDQNGDAPGFWVDPPGSDSTSTPEPSTLLLLGMGLAALAGFYRKWKAGNVSAD
jgi:hypothetical protein